MKRFQILSGLILSAALLTQVATARDHHDKRYYDRDGRDYHVYNSQEDRAYRVYLGEQHRDFRQFHKVKPAQQQEYFRWRHEHPNEKLFRVEGR